MLRPRRNAMFSSIYQHDLESPCLWCFGPCGALLGKYCDYDLPITNSFWIVLLDYSKLSFGLLFSDSGRDNAFKLAPSVSALGSGVYVNIS